MALEVLHYQEVLKRLSGRTHLLLGNGFSIACQKTFAYGSLYEYAKKSGFSDRVVRLFGRLGTNNFEGVMRLLEDGDWVSEEYEMVTKDGRASEMLSDLEAVKNGLLKAVADTHPDQTNGVTDERKACCADFLEPYHNVFSANYDLLLYWVEMHALDKLQGRDGFRADPDNHDADYVVFSERIGGDKGIFFIHGALHIYVANGEVRKHTWSRTQKSLIESIRESLTKGQYPLFVAEGMHEKKLEQIQRSGYLSYCLGKLERIQNALVVYGLSFGDSDGHITEVVAKNKDLKTLFVGLYGDPKASTCLGVQQSVARILERRKSLIDGGWRLKPLDVAFYDAQTVSLWDEIKPAAKPA